MTSTRKLLLLALLVLGASIFLVACGGDDDDGGDDAEETEETTASAEEILTETFANNEQITSGTIEMSINGSAESAEGSGSGEASLTGSFQGEEGNPSAIPELDLQGDLSYEVEGLGSDSSSGGITVTDENMYVTIDDQAYEVGGDLSTQFRDTFEQAAAMSAATSGATGEAGTTASLDAQCQTLIEQLGGNVAACDEIDVFSWMDLTVEDQTEIDGATVDHVSGTFNIPAMIDNVNAAIEASEIPGAEPIPEEQASQAEEAITELSFDVYSGTEDRLLRGLDFNTSIDPSAVDPSEDTGAVTVGFEIRYGGINEPQTIEAPAGAQPIDDLLEQYGLNSDLLSQQLSQSMSGVGGMLGGSADFGGSTDDLGGTGGGSGGGGGGGGSTGGIGSGGGGATDAETEQALEDLEEICLQAATTPQEKSDCEAIAP